jgi:simple sugar transport system substrate-binding protein
MLQKLTPLLAGAVLALAIPAMAEAKTFYWISHGSPADPVWT